jgi:uncharacterized membrane protein YeaQ/YmgE (transglycosylase-associated protein family)
MRVLLWTIALGVVGFWFGAPIGTVFRELAPDRGLAFAIVGACAGIAIGTILQRRIQRKAQDPPVPRLV